MSKDKKTLDLPIKTIGEPDIPVVDDLLGIKNYVTGLVNFTSQCRTPMAVALQGDWGTGKTSFIKMMQAVLDKPDNAKKIKTIYFNTWQYSQFNSSQDLYTSFAVCLINALSKGTDTGKPGEFSGKAKKFLVSVVEAGIDVGRQVIKNQTGLDLGKVQKDTEVILDKMIEKNQKITDLKATFSELISDAAGEDGRVIIFIDDLDRLNPETAVALLETIKLFMDVEKCVFVLAIDYEVVVRGIRKKYGADMDDSKCRSFFDKIIQLPFRMPTEKYVINNMLQNISIGGKIEGYEDIVSNLIKDTLGPNPRTIKRVVNAFELLSFVDSASDNLPKADYQNVLLLISLILQIYDENTYSELLDNASDMDKFKLYRDNKDDQDDDKIAPFFKAISDIEAKNSDSKEEITEELINLLSLSAMTTVTTETSADTSQARKVDKIVLENKEFGVNTPTAAMRQTVEYLLDLAEKQGKTAFIVENFNKLLSVDETFIKNETERKKTVFAAYYEIPNVKDGDRTIYLALNTHYEQKLSSVRKLCKELGVGYESVKWFNDSNELIWNK